MATVIKRRAKFSDSFTNATYKLGLGTDNPLSSATYSLNNLLSRDRTTLEAGYRSSWLIGQAVDTVAEDMTKMGIDMFSKMAPDDIKKLQVCINDYSVWESYCQIIKWARLYGGALGIIIIDGADYSKPMNLEAIGKDTFKGILVLDRWMCEPVLTELIEEFGKDFAKPKYYRIHSSVANLKLPDQKIHYSRIMRFDGVSLPFYQRIYENHWGLSVVERIYDRLISYDSATLGASQLMYKSFLRIVGINGLREALALGGKEESAIIKMFEMIRQYQSNEGITLLDKDDSFSVQSNTFGGAADLLRQFSEQISGATGIPLVRLFGQSPSGFSTGDTDLRNYYDNINREQENKLRPHLTKLLEIICKSKLGKALPEDFEYKFISLWQMSDKEKSEITTSDVASINSAYQGGLVSKEVAAKELLQLSRTTGRFTNITEEDIEKAKEEDANQPPPGMMPEENVEENPLAEQKEGVDLTAKTPESYQEQSIKSPLEGREESINAREQETQRDEIEEPKPFPIKSLKEIVSPNILKNNSVIANVQNTIKEKFTEAAKNVYQKFFSKDKETTWEIVVFNKIENELQKFYVKAEDEYKARRMAEENLRRDFGTRAYNISKVNDADFKESEHPRAKSGKHAGEFTKKGSGGGASSSKETKTEKKEPKPKKPYQPPEKIIPAQKKSKKTQNFSDTKRDKEGKLRLANGKSLPEHLSHIPIPPAWQNVIVNPDSEGELLAVGYVWKASGGVARQSIYSKGHNEKALKEQIKMVDNLNKQYGKITNQVNDSLKNGDLIEKENAFIVKLVDHTSIRIGSSEEALGKQKTYGASTLEARHIIPQNDGTVMLEFVGKKGVDNKFPVTDKKLSSTLLKLKNGADPNTRIFKTDYSSVLNYMKNLDGGEFTIKDLRTKFACDRAIEKINSMPTPTNPKDYKKAIKEVGVYVSGFLNNTPSMALKAYIMPNVFDKWKKKAGVKE